jgi:hypothetical protein
MRMLVELMSLAFSLAPPLVTTEGVTLDEAGRAPVTLPFVGVQLDVGVPDGLGASLVVTPARFLRLHVGGLNNGVGSGARLGAWLVAFPSGPFRPLVGFDAGYVFGGQGAWLPQLVSDATARQVIDGLTVGFVNAHVGFELGSKNVAFTLRAGLSYIDVSGGSLAFATSARSQVNADGLTLTGLIPSARLGFLICFG